MALLGEFLTRALWFAMTGVMPPVLFADRVAEAHGEAGLFVVAALCALGVIAGDWLICRWWR